MLTKLKRIFTPVPKPLKPGMINSIGLTSRGRPHYTKFEVHILPGTNRFESLYGHKFSKTSYGSLWTMHSLIKNKLLPNDNTFYQRSFCLYLGVYGADGISSMLDKKLLSKIHIRHPNLSIYLAALSYLKKTPIKQGLIADCPFDKEGNLISFSRYGLELKVMAAVGKKMKEIIFPEENKTHFITLKKKTAEKIKIHFVKSIEEAEKIALQV